MVRPSAGFPTWATNNEVDPVTGVQNKTEPSTEFKLSGLKRGEPLFRTHVNYQFDLISDWIEHLDSASIGITEDTVYYVSPTGSDLTGDGQNPITAYRSPHRAMEELQGRTIADNVTVTIILLGAALNAESGIEHVWNPYKPRLLPTGLPNPDFNEGDVGTLIIQHPYANRIKIVGETWFDLDVSAPQYRVKPRGYDVPNWTKDIIETLPKGAIGTPLLPEVPLGVGEDKWFCTSGQLPVNASRGGWYTRGNLFTDDPTNPEAINPAVDLVGSKEYYKWVAGSVSLAIEDDLQRNRERIRDRWRVIVKCNRCSAISTRGSNSLGLLDHIAFDGDWTASNDNTPLIDPSLPNHPKWDTSEEYKYVGIEAVLWESAGGTPTGPSGGQLYLGSNVVIIGFQGEGINARYGGRILSSTDDIANKNPDTSRGGISVLNCVGDNVACSFSGLAILPQITSLGSGRNGISVLYNSHGRFDHGSYYCGNRTAGITIGNNSGVRSASSTQRASAPFIGSINYMCGNNGLGLTVESTSSFRTQECIIMGNIDDGARSSLGSSVILDSTICSGNGAIGLQARDSSVIRCYTVGKIVNKVSYNMRDGIAAIRGSTINLAGICKIGVNGFSQWTSGNVSDRPVTPTYFDIQAQIGGTIICPNADQWENPTKQFVMASGKSVITSKKVVGLKCSPAWNTLQTTITASNQGSFIGDNVSNAAGFTQTV